MSDYQNYIKTLSNTDPKVFDDEKYFKKYQKLKQVSVVNIKIPFFKKEITVPKAQYYKTIKYGIASLIGISLVTVGAKGIKDEVAFRNYLNNLDNYVAEETHVQENGTYFHNHRAIANDLAQNVTDENDFKANLYNTYDNFSYHAKDQIDKVYSNLPRKEMEETLIEKGMAPEEASQFITKLLNNATLDDYLDNQSMKDLRQEVKQNFLEEEKNDVESEQSNYNARNR